MVRQLKPHLHYTFDEEDDHVYCYCHKMARAIFWFMRELGIKVAKLQSKQLDDQQGTATPSIILTDDNSDEQDLAEFVTETAKSGEGERQASHATSSESYADKDTGDEAETEAPDEEAEEAGEEAVPSGSEPAEGGELLSIVTRVRTCMPRVIGYFIVLISQIEQAEMFSRLTLRSATQRAAFDRAKGGLAIKPKSGLRKKVGIRWHNQHQVREGMIINKEVRLKQSHPFNSADILQVVLAVLAKDDDDIYKEAVLKNSDFTVLSELNEITEVPAVVRCVAPFLIEICRQVIMTSSRNMEKDGPTLAFVLAEFQSVLTQLEAAKEKVQKSKLAAAADLLRGIKVLIAKVTTYYEEAYCKESVICATSES
jgi:hypothetical protein